MKTSVSRSWGAEQVNQPSRTKLGTLQNGSILAAIMASQTLTGSAVAAEKNSILSCKFGSECNVENFDCSEYDSWHFVRHYPSEDRYTVFDALNSHEKSAEYREYGDLSIWDTSQIQKSPIELVSSEEFVVAPNLQATIAASGYIEINPGEKRLYAYSLEGMCQEIN